MPDQPQDRLMGSECQDRKRWSYFWNTVCQDYGHRPAFFSFRFDRFMKCACKETSVRVRRSRPSSATCLFPFPDRFRIHRERISSRGWAGAAKIPVVGQREEDLNTPPQQNVRGGCLVILRGTGWFR